MKKILAVSMAAILVAFAAPVLAAGNAQQSKMTDCNKQAGDKKGDDRKAFMKTCLSAGSATASTKKLTPQQEKMGACNKQASDKKGDDRKAFMKQCLSAG